MIIDGWQRYEGVFDVPADAGAVKTSYVTVTLVASTNSGENTWFDDVRVQPFNSNMKSFIYDIASRKLTAILDENNYATIYEYDEQGGLKRVKKETTKGIVTVSESRKNNVKRTNDASY